MKKRSDYARLVIDNCDDDPKFLYSDDKEIVVIINGDHTSAVENSAPLPVVEGINLFMHSCNYSTFLIYDYPNVV